MRDEIIRFVGGPRDGEAVKFPPHFMPMRADEVETKRLPRDIDLETGGRYRLDQEMKRYVWREP